MHCLGIALALIALLGTMGLAKAQDDITAMLSEIIEPSVQPIYLLEGTTLRMVCEVKDVSTVSWEKGEVLVDSTSTTGIVIMNHRDRRKLISTLEKQGVTRDDTNNYSCIPEGQKNRGYNVMVNVFSSDDAASYKLAVDIRAEDATIEEYGRNEVTLQCVVENLPSYQPMQWFREGERIIDAEDKYVTNSENGTLTISKPMPEDAGEYECVVNLENGEGFNKTVNLYSIPYVIHFPQSRNLVQGDPLELNCNVEGNPPPVLTWMKDGVVMSESDYEGRLSFKTNEGGVANGTLRLEELDFEDRAEYTCKATNDYGDSNSTVLVRVKDKLAALWPFIGICIEVAILVIIIFIYERRRAKKLEELDAKEEADHLTNSHSHKGADEVRQRK